MEKVIDFMVCEDNLIADNREGGCTETRYKTK